MNAERWVDVERLFHAAFDRPPRDRPYFLRQACGADVALYDEVQSLLDQSDPGDPFLENASPPTGSALIGRRLRDYHLHGWIGAGGMGEVYRARDLKLGRDVAIKLLPPALARDPERVARFRREAQI
jgi:serine/threonine protein kinase